MNQPIYQVHLGKCAVTAKTFETSSMERALRWANTSIQPFRLVTEYATPDAMPKYIIGSISGHEAFFGEGE